MEWLVSSLVSFVLTCIVGFLAYRRLRNAMWETIEDFSVQFSEKLSGVLSDAITPTVKKGFSMAGSLGGEAKATKELQNRMAKGFIDNNFGELKMLAEQVLGIDVEGMLEQYGAPTVLKAIQGFMPIIQGKGGSSLISSFLGNRQKGHNSSGVPEM